MTNTVQEFYGNRVRVRVCGLCELDGGLVMVNHPLSGVDFWAPPGGGLEFGETVSECLIREMNEETGLEVTVGDFLFVTEFNKPPLHAIELFFSVRRTGGSLTLGTDPEMGDRQILSGVKIWSWQEIESANKAELHGIFQMTPHPKEISDLRGYFKL